jgi:peptidoglycan/xylan/chitin deacetylase (PgdA/CDA1 family)
VPLARRQVAPRRLAISAATLVTALLLSACGSGSGPAAGTGQSAPAGGSTAPSHGRAQRAVRRVLALPLPPAPAPRSVRIPVITFHRVHAFATELVKSLPDLTIEPSTFYAEMQALAGARYHSISIEQLYDALFHGSALPSRPVLISVDDGYVDDTRTILPVLRRFHLRATFFVIVGRDNQPGFVTPSQMRELDGAGMDVEDHSLTHIDLRTVTGSALKAQVTGSKRTLEGILGHPVSAIAYPFGTYNATVLAAVRAAGYSLGFTTMGGESASSTASLTIPRIHIGRAQTASGLLSLLAGATSASASGGD